VLALATAKPALVGPNAAVNAMHYNRIMEISDECDRLRYIAAERAKYEAEVDVFHVASENSIEAVVPGAELRDELVRRFAAYRRRSTPPHQRRNGVYPV
jgi:acetyl-CoA carboxylase carboxyltransferase component